MFRKTVSGIQDRNISLSKLPAEDYYYRKFNLKSFSIKVDKLPEKCSPRKYESDRNNIRNSSVDSSKSSPLRKQESSGEYRRPGYCICVSFLNFVLPQNLFCFIDKFDVSWFTGLWQNR